MTRIKMLGAAAVAALTMSGVAAASASAAHWRSAGEPLTSPLSIASSLKSTDVVVSVPGVITLEGTGFSTEGASIEGTEDDEAEALIFTGVVDNEESRCEVNSLGEPKGTVKTHAVKTHLAEVSESSIDDIFTPAGGNASGEEFVTLEIHGSRCPTVQTDTLSGSIVGAEETPNTESTTQALKFPSGGLSYGEFGHLLYGAHSASLVMESNQTASTAYGVYAG